MNKLNFRVAEPLRLGALTITATPKRGGYAETLNYLELSI
jgi:hypothetical protein